MKRKSKSKKEMCEPIKEAKLEHKIVKESRKLAKDVSKDKKNYGK